MRTEDRAGYMNWMAMKSRCYNKNNKDYKNYGGRGITVCEEWQSMKGFEKWALSSGFEKGLTIERKDVNGNYEPSNCYWIERESQCRNTRRNNKISIDEASEICEAYATGLFRQKDIAKYVGVFTTTISRLVNCRWHIVNGELFVNNRREKC